jgi:hypothetical protein
MPCAAKGGDKPVIRGLDCWGERSFGESAWYPVRHRESRDEGAE